MNWPTNCFPVSNPNFFISNNFQLISLIQNLQHNLWILQQQLTASSTNFQNLAQGQNWNGQNWNGQNWNGQNWNGQNWNGQNWNGQNWNGQTAQGWNMFPQPNAQPNAQPNTFPFPSNTFNPNAFPGFFPNSFNQPGFSQPGFNQQGYGQGFNQQAIQPQGQPGFNQPGFNQPGFNQPGYLNGFPFPNAFPTPQNDLSEPTPNKRSMSGNNSRTPTNVG